MTERCSGGGTGDHDFCKILTRITTLEERFQANNEALGIARGEIDRRLEGMNELRMQIDRERGMYITHEKYEAKHEILTNSVRSLEKFQYMAMGALLAIQVLIGFLMRYWK
jgi:hypothetical protein